MVVTAGTSDIPVAEEAAITAEIMGNRVERIYDVGVAGLHRLMAQREKIENAAELKLFHDEGYYFNERLSTGNVWTFTRG